MKISDLFNISKRVKTWKKLNEIENEMKHIGYWQSKPKRIKVKSYLDSPSFELWLQRIFVPNARRAALTGFYPNESQVGLMAMREYDYHSKVDKAEKLMRLLNEFDLIVKS